MDLCPPTGLGKAGQGENSLGDQVVSISSSLRLRGVGDTFHGLVGLLPCEHQLCLCAPGSGRGTLERTNSYQGCRKAAGCLTHTPPRGLAKGQAEQMPSLFSFLTTRLLTLDPSYPGSCREGGWRPTGWSSRCPGHQRHGAPCRRTQGMSDSLCGLPPFCRTLG